MSTQHAPVLGPWDRSVDGRIGPALHQCLTAAIAAPSIHNTQPWRFRPFRGGVDVYADRSRRLDVIDPSGREMLISIGAALLNLRISALAQGRMPMQELLPDPLRPGLVARIRFGPSTHVTETVRLLNLAIPRRHTIRKPFSDDAVPPEVMHELIDAANVEGGRLVPADSTTREAVLSLVRLAQDHERRDPRYWSELSEWTHPTRERHDGVPPRAFGPWSALELIPIRDFGLLEPVPRRRVAWFEPEPTIAVLYTAGDGAHEWVRAGEALERTLLTACVRGLSTTLMTQPLEMPALRSLLDDTATGQVAQAIIRFGYGPIGGGTPRRPIEDVLL